MDPNIDKPALRKQFDKHVSEAICQKVRTIIDSLPRNPDPHSMCKTAWEAVKVELSVQNPSIEACNQMKQFVHYHVVSTLGPIRLNQGLEIMLKQ